MVKIRLYYSSGECNVFEIPVELLSDILVILNIMGFSYDVPYVVINCK